MGEFVQIVLDLKRVGEELLLLGSRCFGLRRRGSVGVFDWVEDGEREIKVE